MILEQMYLGCLSQASYFIADEGSGRAVVVDPRRDVGIYLDEASGRGVKIEQVILTHGHADFLAGHLELRANTGATIAMGARAEAEFPFQRLSEGDVISLGDVRLKILDTPGHTPESICILVFDGDPAETAPHAVLTGDTLFIGDVGRPDLMSSKGLTAEELAGQLYDSLHEKILSLPDATLVYPGHGAGSACGKNLSTDTVSTIGQQRRFNYALQPMSREAFVAQVTANQPDAPAYFPFDAELNRRERATLEESLGRSLRALDLDQLREQQTAGAVVLDVRPVAEFAAGHLERSLGIALDGRFASWAGTIIPPGTPIVLVADEGTEREAALRLGRIGFDSVVGYLEKASKVITKHRESLRSWQRTEPAAEALRGRLVVDVRSPGEFADGHLEGARNLCLTRLEKELDELPRDQELLLVCQTGYRSAIAAGLLQRMGYEQITDLDGGFAAWTAAGLPVVQPTAR